MSRKALTFGVVLATILWSMMATVLIAPLKAEAAGCVSGSLIKGSMSAVYYCGADGKRYVFTNDKNYFTWYANFSGVQTISDADLATITIGGNVTYRPGVKMVKIESDPKTYAVAHGGVLRHIASEAIAACLYGSTWNQQIDDISVAFWVNYTMGAAINVCADYNRSNEMASSDTINEDKGLTAVPPGPPSVSMTSPANGAVNVAVTSSVSATFSEAMNASTLNTGTFLLMRGSTSVAGTVSYSNNTATFFPNANLEASTTYTATVTTGARDMDGNTLSANYTWSFSTGPTISSPTVTSTSPSSGATNVAMNAAVSATFSEQMNASTLNTSTFTLMQGSASVSGTVGYSGNTATFTPNAQLAANTTYTATINTGARDMDGNQLVSAHVWSFTTGNFAAGAPIVLSTSPANGATGVAVTSTVSATFNEPMNASTLNTGTFTLTRNGTSVSGTVSYSNNTATFFPNANLTAGATHTATVTTGARDADNNAMASNHVWTFVTAP